MSKWLDIIKQTQEPPPSVEETIKQIFAGTYNRNELLPVKEQYRNIWQAVAVWVCADEKVAELKRKNKRNTYPVFTVTEWKLAVESLQKDEDSGKSLLDWKYFFNGTIEELKQDNKHGQ